MKRFLWNSGKDDELKRSRGISFEDVVAHVEGGHILDIIPHPNQKKYPHQEIMILNINGYAYAVPYVVSPKGIFLKTIIPSRKYTRKYLRENKT